MDKRRGSGSGSKRTRVDISEVWEEEKRANRQRCQYQG